MHEVPSSVRRVVEDWRAAGQPPQPPIPWPRQRWIEDFPEHRDALARLPDRLDRNDVRAAGADAPRSTGQAVDAFLAAMAWGYGDTVGYGRFRTRRILDSREDAPDRLRAVAIAVAEEGAIFGYRALATTSRLEGLGPAFGTKLLYFWQPPGARPQALIFDAFVAGWLDRHAGIRIDAVQWSVKAYSRYLELMHTWADELRVQPDELEMCIFRDEASGRGSQWGDGRPKGSLGADPVFELVSRSPTYLPFAAYPQGGRALLGKPRGGDGTARRSYGVAALQWGGYRCAYCDLDMSTFEGWLQLSIDHVVPQQMHGQGYPAEWVLDAANVVAACVACNGYFNRDPVLGDVPATLEAFFELRDRVFKERRARIQERRSAERSWFEANLKPR